MSLTDQAYSLIKHKIITCEFSPGQPLIEQDLINQLQLGRTPIHQAIHRLAQEGMLTILPRKGVLVTPISLNQIIDIIEVRVANEVLCASLAVEHATKEDIAQMNDIINQTEYYLSQQNTEELMKLDLQFHKAISTAAKNKILAELLERLHEMQARFWFITLSDQQHSENIYHEHLRILKAIKNRDLSEATNAIRAHINNFKHSIIQSI
ncbi:GntR family transcriptional regulator [Neisseria sp. Ec49-e6-T10]|uniref:GntR family transcriptional regulator n=1 Tax=Neisseria sp. Ec49-e6-T10 TaxID=3140744 RepID=UPI003EBF5C94